MVGSYSFITNKQTNTNKNTSTVCTYFFVLPLYFATGYYKGMAGWLAMVHTGKCPSGYGQKIRPKTRHVMSIPVRELRGSGGFRGSATADWPRTSPRTAKRCTDDQEPTLVLLRQKAQTSPASSMYDMTPQKTMRHPICPSA